MLAGESGRERKRERDSFYGRGGVLQGEEASTFNHSDTARASGSDFARVTSRLLLVWRRFGGTVALRGPVFEREVVSLCGF